MHVLDAPEWEEVLREFSRLDSLPNWRTDVQKFVVSTNEK